MDPWRDKPLEKRPSGEQKFSLKNQKDRVIMFTIGAVILVLLAIIAILIVIFANI